MNRRITYFIPFRTKRRSWTETYLNGNTVSHIWPVLVGVGVGAGLMYVFDPDQGRRRRAIARDKVTSTVNRTGQAISSKSRDLKNRARGVIAQNSSAFRNEDAEKKTQLRQ